MKKVRIYEYAKEVGKQSKDLITVLKDANIEVSNHMSMLTEEGLAKLVFSKNKKKRRKMINLQIMKVRKIKRKKLKKRKTEKLKNNNQQLLKLHQKKQFQKILF